MSLHDWGMLLLGVLIEWMFQPLRQGIFSLIRWWKGPLRWPWDEQ